LITLKELINKTTEYFTNQSIDNPRYECEKFFSIELNLDRLNLYTNYDRMITEAELAKLREKLKLHIKIKKNSDRPMLKSYLNNTITLLQERGISEAKLSAELFFAELFSCKAIEVKLMDDRELSYSEQEEIDRMIQRRLNHEPIQYILGYTEFYGLELHINKSALIPRPETELLVERVIELIQNENIESIIDIGTGSACIPIAIKTHAQNCNILGIDKSDKALRLAQRNIDRYNLEISLLELDFINEDIDDLENIDLLISNPPYVSESEYKNLEKQLVNFEPEIALTDNSDGLLFYKKIAEVSAANLKEGAWIIIEIGYKQADIIKDIFKSRQLNYISSVYDLENIERHLLFRKENV
jgi:release factor glutamine methyltransferase